MSPIAVVRGEECRRPCDLCAIGRISRAVSRERSIRSYRLYRYMFDVDPNKHDILSLPQTSPPTKDEGSKVSGNDNNQFKILVCQQQILVVMVYTHLSSSKPPPLAQTSSRTTAFTDKDPHMPLHIHLRNSDSYSMPPSSLMCFHHPFQLLLNIHATLYHPHSSCRREGCQLCWELRVS